MDGLRGPSARGPRGDARPSPFPTPRPPWAWGRRRPGAGPGVDATRSAGARTGSATLRRPTCMPRDVVAVQTHPGRHSHRSRARHGRQGWHPKRPPPVVPCPHTGPETQTPGSSEDPLYHLPHRHAPTRPQGHVFPRAPGSDQKGLVVKSPLRSDLAPLVEPRSPSEGRATRTLRPLSGLRPKPPGAARGGLGAALEPGLRRPTPAPPSTP